MRPLVALRRAAPFDPRVLSQTLARSPLFWPLVRAASALAGHDDFPPVEALGRVFAGAPPVRFVAATPRRRRNRGDKEPRRVDPGALYDARITVDREVPTRARCWHDLMNALVWGTFPLAKRALHARQHSAVCARVAPGDTCLPAARTPELDALAILDEGGVAVLSREPLPMHQAANPKVWPERVLGGLGMELGGNGSPPKAWLAKELPGISAQLVRGPSASALRTGIASGAAVAVIFGHAIYESLALGVAPAVVAAVVLERDERDGRNIVACADRALARAIDDRERLRTPNELTRLDVKDLLAP